MSNKIISFTRSEELNDNEAILMKKILTTLLNEENKHGISPEKVIKNASIYLEKLKESRSIGEKGIKWDFL